MGSVVEEAVEQLDIVAVISRDFLQPLGLFLVIGLKGSEPFFLHPVGRALIEDFDLVKGSLQIL